MRFFLLCLMTVTLMWAVYPTSAVAEEAVVVDGSSEGSPEEDVTAAVPTQGSGGVLDLWLGPDEVAAAVRGEGIPPSDGPAEGQIDGQQVVVTSEGSVDAVVEEEQAEDGPTENAEEESDEWRPSTFVSLGHQLSVSSDGATPYLTLFLSHGLTPTVSVMAFSMVNARFAETYGGLSVRLLPWLQFGLAVGLESSDGLWRTAATLAVSHAWFSLNWTFEYGAGGRWHLLTIDFRLSDGLSIGLMSKRFDGEGVYLAIRSGRVLFRLAALYDGERAISEVGDGVEWSDARFFTGLLTIGFNLSDAPATATATADDAAERQPASSGTLHLFVSASGDGLVPNLGLWLTRPLSGRFGLWYFGVVAPEYGEAYGGLTVTPWEWLTIGLAVGIETSEDIWRLAGSVDLVWERFSVNLLVEIGGADWCHFLSANYRVTDSLTVGLMSKRFDGEGAFLELSVGDIAFRAAFLYDIERARHEVGDGGVEWADPEFLTGFLWFHAELW